MKNIRLMLGDEMSEHTGYDQQRHCDPDWRTRCIPGGTGGPCEECRYADTERRTYTDRGGQVWCLAAGEWVDEDGELGCYEDNTTRSGGREES